MQVKKQQLEPYTEQLTGSKLGKGYATPVHCHLVYLAYMQSCFCSVAQSCLTVTPCASACLAFLSLTISWRLPKSMSIVSGMPYSHLVLCFPLLLLPSIFPSIRNISKESAVHISLPKILEFQLQHQSFQWIFRIDFA